MIEKIKKSLEKCLKRYGKIPRGEEGEIDYYLKDYEKTITLWTINIILTALPIYLIFLFTGKYSLWNLPIAISIAWWIVIEFRKDWKKVK